MIATIEMSAEILASTPVKVKFDGQTWVDSILAALHEATGLEFRLENGARDPKATLIVQDVAAEHALSWTTLPCGLDARIENGAVVVFERGKRFRPGPGLRGIAMRAMAVSSPWGACGGLGLGTPAAPPGRPRPA